MRAFIRFQFLPKDNTSLFIFLGIWMLSLSLIAATFAPKAFANEASSDKTTENIKCGPSFLSEVATTASGHLVTLKSQDCQIAQEYEGMNGSKEASVLTRRKSLSLAFFSQKGKFDKELNLDQLFESIRKVRKKENKAKGEYEEIHIRGGAFGDLFFIIADKGRQLYAAYPNGDIFEIPLGAPPDNKTFSAFRNHALCDSTYYEIKELKSFQNENHTWLLARGSAVGEKCTLFDLREKAPLIRETVLLTTSIEIPVGEMANPEEYRKEGFSFLSSGSQKFFLYPFDVSGRIQHSAWDLPNSFDIGYDMISLTPDQMVPIYRILATGVTHERFFVPLDAHLNPNGVKNYLNIVSQTESHFNPHSLESLLPVGVNNQIETISNTKNSDEDDEYHSAARSRAYRDSHLDAINTLPNLSSISKPFTIGSSDRTLAIYSADDWLKANYLYHHQTSNSPEGKWMLVYSNSYWGIEIIKPVHSGSRRYVTFFTVDKDEAKSNEVSLSPEDSHINFIEDPSSVYLLTQPSIKAFSTQKYPSAITISINDNNTSQKNESIQSPLNLIRIQKSPDGDLEVDTKFPEKLAQIIGDQMAVITAATFNADGHLFVAGLDVNGTKRVHLFQVKGDPTQSTESPDQKVPLATLQ